MGGWATKNNILVQPMSPSYARPSTSNLYNDGMIIFRASAGEWRRLLVGGDKGGGGLPVLRKTIRNGSRLGAISGSPRIFTLPLVMVET